MEEGLVESAACLAMRLANTGLVDELVLVGFTEGLTVSCRACSPASTGLVDGFERDWLISARRRTGSGGLAEDNGLAWGETLAGESWNIDCGLEGWILIVTLVGVCFGSGLGSSLDLDSFLSVCSGGLCPAVVEVEPNAEVFLA